MKYIISIITAIVLVFPAQAQKDTSQPNYVSAVIAFYNLENLFDTVHNTLIDDYEFLPNSVRHYNTAVYTKKINNMANVISQIGTDVNPDGVALLGVAEIENDTVLADIILNDKLAGRGYSYIHFNSPDARGIDCGLIYSTKYFQHLSSSPYRVKLPDGHPTRDILYVKGLLAGEEVHILVNHWPSRSGGSFTSRANTIRRSDNPLTTVYNNNYDNQRSTSNESGQAEDEGESSQHLRIAAGTACRAIYDSILKADPNANIIIMGDLNDDPTSPGVTVGLKAKGNINKVTEADIYDPYADIHSKGFGTLAYNGKWNLFDQMMFSYPLIKRKEDGWFLFKSYIFYREFLITQKGNYKGYPYRTWSGDQFINGYSDHLPIYSVLLKKMN